MGAKRVNRFGFKAAFVCLSVLAVMVPVEASAFIDKIFPQNLRPQNSQSEAAQIPALQTSQNLPVSRPLEWREQFEATNQPASGLPDVSTPLLTPLTVSKIDETINLYGQIAAQGGWPQVPTAVNLKIGTRHPNVAILRQRLLITGDLTNTQGRADTFDSYVDKAVKQFQIRHGLVPDGVVSEATFSALNVPVQSRIRQLELNLVRLNALSGDLGARYVMMNIPAAELEAVENGFVVSRHTTVVGKVDRQSPVLATKVAQVDMNPYWTVPISIIRKDLIPKVQADPDYLKKNKIRIYRWDSEEELDQSTIDWSTDEATKYRFRQDPGAINSMGSVKIFMPNEHNVYMHDTPTKSFFGEANRFHSSGCARVQNVRELVSWLLKGQEDWDRPKVDAQIRSGERTIVNIKETIPVYWVYITAWVNDNGMVQFRDDIYNRDGLGQTAQNAIDKKIINN